MHTDMLGFRAARSVSAAFRSCSLICQRLRLF